MTKGTRIKVLKLSLKNGEHYEYERGKSNIKQITETPEQLVVMDNDSWYHFFPKENINVFTIQTEEFELVSDGGIILPDTASNQVVKEPF